MIISVPKETVPGERRVALAPDAVKRLSGSAVQVRVERGAGVAAKFSDEEYRAVGAEIVADGRAVRTGADVDTGVLVLQAVARVTHDQSFQHDVGCCHPQRVAMLHAA